MGLTAEIPYFSLAPPTEIPYIPFVQTVVETRAFLASAKDEGVADEERQEIVAFIANNPSVGHYAGDGRRAKGQGREPRQRQEWWLSCYHYAADDIPVFLLDIYGKIRRQPVEGRVQ
ncbi:hypothetical protein [Pararhizobium sp. LjRoot238]|uniref:hypothetical protein n=1 Tax=Pararhizobium sp. LjRoot238 TaxID=3342293 RepID=UPI003ED068E9